MLYNFLGVHNPNLYNPKIHPLPPSRSPSAASFATEGGDRIVPVSAAASYFEDPPASAKPPVRPSSLPIREKGKKSSYV